MRRQANRIPLHRRSNHISTLLETRRALWDDCGCGWDGLTSPIAVTASLTKGGMPDL